MQQTVDLIPEHGVEEIGGERLACEREPWLRLASTQPLSSGGWFRLRYRSSFFDDPVRPLMRFISAGGNVSIQALNGPVLGIGESVLRVPDDTIAISVSPVARPGRFHFAIDSIERVSQARLLAQGVWYGPKWAMVSFGAGLISARKESEQALRFAMTSTNFSDYGAWYRRLARPLDLEGIDRPRSDWAVGPIMRLVMALQSDVTTGLDATLKSLRSQIYSRWILHALVGPLTDPALLAYYRREARQDSRFVELNASVAANDFRATADDRLAVIGVGDTLPNYSLAVVVETIAHHPTASILYGDEDAVAHNGSLHGPRFKPNWSPTFEAGSPYVGRLTCIRYGDLARIGWGNPERLLVGESEAVQSLARGAKPGNVIHVRRILYRRTRQCKSAESRVQRTNTAVPRIDTYTKAWPEVAVILPTRDHAEDLRRCIRGLRETTDYPNLSVVIIDNDSRAPDAIALLNELATDPRFTVLRFPGPFNYSAICNYGARYARAAVLLLLNNDIAMIESDWLKPLVALAIRNDVGAVGAKLFYPNDRIQHAGIVIGSGGRAGHLYKDLPKTESGYLNQLRTTREVSAVTGACIAIERAKFEAVGGLDATNLPVDLSDVDLCLRLCERGWKTVWSSESVLIHRESASRRQILNPSSAYRREREYFTQRWRHVIRDDPYFHPALSLFSHRPALGLR